VGEDKTGTVYDHSGIPKIEHIEFPGTLAPVTKRQQGVYTFIAHNEQIEQQLLSRYGRPALCLKVFKLDTLQWGTNPLIDCTRIQNIFAMRDLAPRVYAIVRANDQYAQVTDYLSGEGEWKPECIKEIMRHAHVRASWDMNPKNWVAGKLVDFQPWTFTHPQRYVQQLIDSAFEYAAWGSRPEPYQSVFDVGGQRDFQHRAEMMELDKLSFEGKTVLDIGCNLGLFCYEATRQKAGRVVGIDLPHVTSVAAELANWNCYWNIDFLGLHLPDEQHPALDQQYDIVFALSVDRQVGYSEWMANLCADVFYLEGHVPDREETFRPRLEQHFREVEFLGMTRDHGPRPLFRCLK